MDIRSILKARGLSDENIENLVTKPEYSQLLESFVAEAENGKTALLKAQEIETNLKTWNDTQVVPYVRSADEKVAKKEAEIAAMRAHMKSLKDSGYEIPDAYLDASSSTVTPPAKTESAAFDPKIIDDRMLDVAKTNMALVTLSNRHRKLTGDELDLDNEYTDFSSNKRPNENLREYIARKYDHAGKEQARAAAAEQKKLDDYAAEKIKAEKANWVAANGVNPETRNPKSSKFDSMVKDEGRAKLWQTAQGREQATKMRLEKYQSLVQ